MQPRRERGPGTGGSGLAKGAGCCPRGARHGGSPQHGCLVQPQYAQGSRVTKGPRTCIFCGGRPLLGSISGRIGCARTYRATSPSIMQAFSLIIPIRHLKSRSCDARASSRPQSSMRVRLMQQQLEPAPGQAKPFIVPVLLGEPVEFHRRAQTNLCPWATMMVTCGIGEADPISAGKDVSRQRGKCRRHSRKASGQTFEQSRHERKCVEMLFAHLKCILKLGRLQLRGPRGAQDEFTLGAIAQNLRRLAIRRATATHCRHVSRVSVRTVGSIAGVKISPLKPLLPTEQAARQDSRPKSSRGPRSSCRRLLQQNRHLAAHP
jgi:hypothetical protein